MLPPTPTHAPDGIPATALSGSLTTAMSGDNLPIDSLRVVIRTARPHIYADEWSSRHEDGLRMKDDRRPGSAKSKKRNREAEVIDAAVEVFFEKGYSAASIQDVADRVGVLKGSLYYYIDSKEDLLF